MKSLTSALLLTIATSCATLQPAKPEPCAIAADKLIFNPMEQKGCKPDLHLYRNSVEKGTKHEMVSFRCPDNKIEIFFGFHTADTATINQELDGSNLKKIGQCVDGTATFDIYHKTIILKREVI